MRQTRMEPEDRAPGVARWVRRAAAVQVQELMAVATIAMMTPLGRSGRRDDAAVEMSSPDAVAASVQTRPVLLVHGLGGTTGGWFALSGALRARGVTVATISYQPFGTTVEQVAERLADRVAQLLEETGADKVHLVGHSLGGVIIAQCLADGFLTDQVDTVVTIASPFGGSPWARVLPVGATVRSLRDGSRLLRRLASAPVPDGVRWLAITATSDLVVPGRRSLPAQAAVQILRVEGVGHIGLLQHPQVVTSIVDALPAYELAAAC
jgi:triacylglycerol lipase